MPKIKVNMVIKCRPKLPVKWHYSEHHFKFCASLGALNWVLTPFKSPLFHLSQSLLMEIAWSLIHFCFLISPGSGPAHDSLVCAAALAAVKSFFRQNSSAKVSRASAVSYCSLRVQKHLVLKESIFLSLKTHFSLTGEDIESMQMPKCCNMSIKIKHSKVCSYLLTVYWGQTQLREHLSG